jgi:osmotically inducible lipoprotein OsmB
MEDLTMTKRIGSTIMVIGIALSLVGCGRSPGERALTGGLIGAGSGAAISGLTGGNPAAGALIGGGVGAIGGAVTAPRRW